MKRVGFYQFDPVFGDVQRNLLSISSALKGVKADLVVLPELALTGYNFKDRKELVALAEDPGGSGAVESLIDLCRGEDLYITTGFAERAGDRCFNSSLLLGPEGLVDTYRKIHLFDREKNLFDPGDLPFKVNSVCGMNIGMMICFDWIFPEASRTLALKGADVICHPANLVLSFCQDAMITRSLENGVYIVTANRTGTESRPHGGLSFTGRSQIVSPKGDLIYRSEKASLDLYIAEIDPALARGKEITGRNHLIGDRRPEFYL